MLYHALAMIVIKEGCEQTERARYQEVDQWMHFPVVGVLHIPTAPKAETICAALTKMRGER
jgi:hypothetical protein